MSKSTEDLCAHVRKILEEEVMRVDSLERAAAVLRHAERLGAGQSEEHKAEQAEQTPTAVLALLERAAHLMPPDERGGATLMETAAHAASSGAEASAVLQAARDVFGATHRARSPAVERSRRLLRAAALREMSLLEALDARAFLAVNRLPHPFWSAALDRVLSVLLIGGGIWILGVSGAALRNVTGSRRALRELVPSVMVATLLVEYPVKGVFRRWRGFDHLLRGLVIGKKPSGRSLPSGHTAASFACATVLGAVWPRQRLLFWGLAAAAGFSRIYAGAHYPSEVLWGALIGVSIAEPIRRATGRWLDGRARHERPGRFGCVAAVSK